MKVAIIGSRNLWVDNIEKYIPEGVTEIVSGGAKGIDACAKMYAQINDLKYTEFLPEYNKYGKRAPLMRNLQIIEYTDIVVALWDGVSKGTRFVIENCEKTNKTVIVYKK